MVLLEEARKHSDDDLVQACRDGEESAFEELVRRYKDRVYNVVYRYLGNPSLGVGFPATGKLPAAFGRQLVYAARSDRVQSCRRQ